MLGSLVIVILIILGSYFAYTNYLSDDDSGNGGDLQNPGNKPDDNTDVQRGVLLQVISDSTHNFAKSSKHFADTSGKTQFLLLVTNTGAAADTFDLTYSGASGGWAVAFDNSRVIVNKDGAQYAIATVTAPASGLASIKITATSANNNSVSDSVDLDCEVSDFGDKTADYGDEVTVYYVLVDRGTDGEYNPDKWVYNQGGNFPFTIGSGVIEGFSNMAIGMKAGETRVALFSAEESYGNNPSDGKPDGPLLYEMAMLEIK
jgi:hypothetical protein